MRKVNNSTPAGNVHNSVGVDIGSGARSEVTFTQTPQANDELIELLQQLRVEIIAAAIPESTKKAMLSGAVPQMEEAVESGDPKPALERGLQRINDNLEGVGAAATNVSGIADKAMRIAQAAGVAVKAVAPFIASI